MTAFVHDVPVTGAATALWQLKYGATIGTLAPTNWEVVSSATGGVYAQSGDVISSESALLSPRAWFVLRGKAVLDGGVAYRQQLCVQTNGAGLVRLKVSPRAGFTAGATSSRVPSASDERVLLGAGTDADPEFAALFPSAGAWLQGRFSEGSDDLWLMAYPTGGGLPTGLLCVLGLPQVRDGVGALVDSAPWAYYAGTGAACATVAALASEASGPMGLLGHLKTSGGTPIEAWCRLPAASLTVYDADGVPQPAVPGHLPESPSRPSGALYAQAALRLSRRSERAGLAGPGEAGALNTCGDKGEVLGVRWSGRRFASPTLLATVSAGGAAASAAVGAGDLILPWECGYALRDGG